MLERRSFLKMALAASSLTTLPYFEIFRNRSHQEEDLKQLREQWIEQFSLFPEDFLEAQGEVTKNSHAYRSQVTTDFIVGDIFEFKGLIMSKTESACLSLLSLT